MGAESLTFQEELILCFKARFTLIYVVAQEEERVLGEIARAFTAVERAAYSWDADEKFKSLNSFAPEMGEPIGDPFGALDWILSLDRDGVFVLKDFHSHWESGDSEKKSRVLRKLKTAAQRLKQTRKSFIIVSHKTNVPEELRDHVHIMDFPLPEYDEIKSILDTFTAMPNIRVRLSELARDRLVQSALGLTANQARRAFSKVIVQKGGLTEEAIDLVTRQKKEIIRESGALEYYPPKETVDQIGGLDHLKAWLRSREGCFSREAEKYGLRPPKGLLLLGIPGTGKSLTAKAVSGLWHQPLLRLDMGAVFGSLVGQSEENVRRALKLAETVSPCVLWIDEVEKGLAESGGDSGTSSRVFGTLLSWMEEKEKPVFVVCTANNISRIPPEFSRAGRFDAIFFLDLPTFGERREIFRVHLLKRRPVLEPYDLDRLAEAGEGFVGAEIEQAILEAMVIAFNDGYREFTTEDILEVIRTGQVVPLSSSQKENIEFLCRWLLQGRARSASFTEKASATKEQVPVPDFEPLPNIEV